jgi:hypothetical protein
VDVLFVDRLEPDMCVDAAGRRVPAAESWNVRYFTEVLCRFGLEGRFACCATLARPRSV